MGVFDEAAKPKSNVRRRVYIKRRDQFTGLFESDWLEITDDVKKFGKIKKTIDATRPYKFTFSNVQIEVANVDGRYNPHDSENSLWFGYLNQQRTLVRIDISFYTVDTTSKEYKIIDEFPKQSLWDEDLWDTESAIYDSTDSTIFTGIISGDIGISDNNSVRFNIRPLTHLFEDYSASNLNGYTSTGITASQFAESLRDAQDSSGNYVFRPFFGDTTTNWNIDSSSNIYSNLNTTTAVDIVDQTAWDVLEKLAEAENYVPFVDGSGVFNFIDRDSVATAASYEFHGAGSFDTTYGNTIIKINSFGFKISKYYSKVTVKFKEDNTTTSYVTSEGSFEVGAANNPWVLGDRQLKIDNTFFGTSTVAQTAADNLYNDLSTLKRELNFESSLVLGLDIFDRVSVNYDPTQVNASSLWDLNDWADNVTSTDADLIWDKTDGEQIRLSGEEFKFLSFEIDLDNLKNRYIAREL